jgi:pyruvate,water dikinase
MLTAQTEGVILVVPHATPDVAAVLPHLAGFIAERGHPTGHAATVLREFAVPSLFEVPGATVKLSTGEMVGLDATGRQVLPGVPWPDVRERTVARLSAPRVERAPSPLHQAIVRLSLTDPMSRRFRPEGCESIHDLIRFMHEKAVATFFEMGDRETRGHSGASLQLETPVPLNLHLLDLGGALPAPDPKRKKVPPEEVRSVPFQALWRGMTHPGVSWTGRTEVNIRGFASVVATSLGGDLGTMRQLGDANYLLVAPEYLNLNIRLAYHYALVDALVGPSAENNYVNFRFRGGGGSADRRDLRARFLTEVLLRSRFGVDRRGDLVTAWLRRYPQRSSEEGLELLGRLMICARQMDMLMESAVVMQHYVERFMSGDYRAFA